jgi:hypothetical protein
MGREWARGVIAWFTGRRNAALQWMIAQPADVVFAAS